MRWKLLLNEFDYDIVYKPGKKNSNVDALSRNPVDFDTNNFEYFEDSDDEDDGDFSSKILQFDVSESYVLLG